MDFSQIIWLNFKVHENTYIKINDTINVTPVSLILNVSFGMGQNIYYILNLDFFTTVSLVF